jgi:GNAT superfamily N-acetyltransferase
MQPNLSPKVILELLDQERRSGVEISGKIEKTPNVVRCLSSDWNGIIYTHFGSEQANSIIRAEVNLFKQLKRSFEWKVYSHDQPSDLLELLGNFGFIQGDEEALMITPLADVSAKLFEATPSNIEIRPITDESMIDDWLGLEQAIWKNSRRTRDVLLSNILDPLKRDLGFIAYFEKTPVGFARATWLPQSRFAGLWGGSVLEEYRGRGIYRNLLAKRIEFLRKHPSVHFLRVDALPTSQPILEKYGFKKLASTWPCEWILK